MPLVVIKIQDIKTDKMKKTLMIIGKVMLITVIIILTWLLFSNNFLLFLSFVFPTAILTGFVYVMLDEFLLKRIKKRN